tara:strand:- start:83 stop:415 length:333 start_codon:yes stop_codon:yes gene_type:complete
MKCVLCSGKLEKKKVEYKEYGVSLGKYSALVCQDCGENFFDSKTVDIIQKKSKEKGLFGISAKKTKVAQVGNSLAIRIPKDIALFTNLKKQGEVRIIPKSKTQILVELSP